MRLQVFFGTALGAFLLGTLVYCTTAVPSDPTTAPPVCDPDSGVGCSCDPGTYKPADCYSGPPGTNGKGICKLGKRSCKNGYVTACEGEVTPQVETCNFADDDCNSLIDDVPEFADAEPIAYCNSPACDPTFRDAGIYCFTAALGICGAGRRTCAPGSDHGTPTGCKAFIKTGVPEECNGFDDDCNGAVDDGLQGTLGDCTADAAVGECANSKTDCSDGGLTCPPADPVAETCDGKDNDCNAKIDDKSCLNLAGNYCCKAKSSSFALCTSDPYYLPGGTGAASYTCVFGK